MDDRDREQENGRRRGGVGGLVISAVCLSVITVLVWLGHGDTSTKLFDPSSYYYGIHKDEEVPSPLEMRNRMVIIKRGQSDSLITKCKPAFKTQSDDIVQIHSGLFAPMVGSNFEQYASTGFTSMTADELNAIFCKDGQGTDKWYCWPDAVEPSSANYILSPTTNFRFSEFSNQKTSDSSHGKCIAICPANSNTHRILFCNVVNWYCHLDTMESVDTHDSLLGFTTDKDFKYLTYNGDSPVILGLGNSATYMIFQKRNSEDEQWQDCPAAEYYLSQ